MSNNFQRKFGSKSVFKSRARNVPQYFSHEVDGYQMFRHRAILVFLSNFKSAQTKNFKILDVGCGTGVLTYKLSKELKIEDIIGCDFVDELVSVARKNYKSIRFEISALPYLEINIQKRDLVVLSEILYYLDNNGIDIAINRINNILSDEGYVFISSKLGGIYGTDNKIISSLKKNNFIIVRKEYLYMSVYHLLFKHLRRFYSLNQLLQIPEANLSEKQKNIFKKYKFLFRVKFFKFILKVLSIGISPLLKSQFLPFLFNKVPMKSKPSNIFILAAKRNI